MVAVRSLHLHVNRFGSLVGALTAGSLAVLHFTSATAQPVSGSMSITVTPAPTLDAGILVQTAAQYASRGNYMGTIVYQRGAHMETFRLAHVFDNGVERERLVMLDGQPKEMIREGDRTETFVPDMKLVRIQAMNERAFPAITTSRVQTLLNFFTAADLGIDRVAGHLARGIAFTPRDPMRYAEHWWMEVNTGLPVRVRVFGDRGDVIEQVSFTDLHLDGRISRHHLRSIYAGKATDWRVENVPAPGNLQAETGWAVRELPPGFAKVREGMRALAGPGQRVPHLLFSDGITTISVFIEPSGAGEPVGLTQSGAVNVYRRQINDNVVTALGRTPPQALKAIADSLAKK
jgi:sigma-E factor negative regulatory protein RseB